MANIYSMADTWDNVSTTFTGIGLNVTDTASASGSLLMDLQVGGVSKFSVNKNGSLQLSLPTNLGELPIVATSSYGLWYAPANVAVKIRSGGINLAEFWRNNEPKIRLNGNVSIGTSDTILARDAANTLAQRNSTNAQTFNLYNTYTDASNYERGFMKWNANVLEIGTEAAGTGSARGVKINSGDGVEFQRVGITAPPRFRHRASNIMDVYLGAAAYYSFNTSFAFQIDSEMQFSWGSGRSDTTADTGIKRNSAGVVKITNGSTGTGELIFVVPTTDPAIAGALWNNGGTLAISAG